jgi:hypothetical protein
MPEVSKGDSKIRNSLLLLDLLFAMRQISLDVEDGGWNKRGLKLELYIAPIVQFILKSLDLEIVWCVCFLGKLSGSQSFCESYEYLKAASRQRVVSFRDPTRYTSTQKSLG